LSKKIIDGKDMEIDNLSLDSIKRLLETKGLPISYKETYLKRRLNVRLRKSGSANFAEYYNLLKKDNTEFENLKKDLSINVTKFFRDLETWEYFQNILSDYLKKKTALSKRVTLRIWSAGCAIGAEPYSIAMMIDQILHHRRYNFDIKINATDFNQDLLSIARRGIYEPESLDELPKGHLKLYFENHAKNQYRLNYRIRKMVDFSHFDLTSNKYPYKNLDVLICRNVLIYFATDYQKIIFQKFFDSLCPNGLLVLGRTESLNLTFRQQFTNISPRHRIYQKIDTLSGDKDETIVYQYCDECKERFIRLIDLKIHQRRHKTKGKKKPYNCKICRKGFLTEVRYKAHLKYFHKKKDPKFPS
jgi:chemotaxis protein methyltransferase CheR